MALKAELEDLLKQMKPEEAESTRKVLEAYPQLADGWLRQADYSRNVAETKAAKERYEKKFQENTEWWNTTKPEVDRYKSENESLNAEVVRLKAAVESAAKTAIVGAGGDGTPVDIKTVTKAVLDQMAANGGHYDQAAIERIAESKAKALVEATVNASLTSGISAATNDFLTKTFPSALGVIADINDLQWEHRTEFGKPLDRKALSEYMTANKITDARKAYEQMVAPERQQKTIRTEAEKLANQIITERHGIPGSGAPGGERGAFQIRLSEDPKIDPMAGKDVKIGSGELARAAAAEMATEGKF